MTRKEKGMATTSLGYTLLAQSLLQVTRKEKGVATNTLLVNYPKMILVASDPKREGYGNGSEGRLQ